jgi:hypothetical protein
MLVVMRLLKSTELSFVFLLNPAARMICHQLQQLLLAR